MRFPLPAEAAFPVAERYVQLQSVLEPEGWIASASLWNDMIVQPVWHFLKWIMGWELSLVSVTLTIMRAIDVWRQWCEYQVLRGTARHWVLLTKLAGGPFISCNDPKYHVFVYADAIERLRLGMPLRGGALRREGRHRVAVPKERLEARKHL